PIPCYRHTHRTNPPEPSFQSSCDLPFSSPLVGWLFGGCAVGFVDQARQAIGGCMAVLFRRLNRGVAGGLAAGAFRVVRKSVRKVILRLNYIKDRVRNRIA